VWPTIQELSDFALPYGVPSECYATTNFLERDFGGVRGRISTSREVIRPSVAPLPRKWQGFLRVRCQSPGAKADHISVQQVSQTRQHYGGSL
jgi:hypothetical protein